MRVNLSSSSDDRKDSDRDFCSTDAHPRTHPSSTQMKNIVRMIWKIKKKKSKGKKNDECLRASKMFFSP